jgi:hypothetical protein
MPGSKGGEVETRGPKQKALLDTAYDPLVETINENNIDGRLIAQQTSDEYEAQAKEVLDRQKAKDVVDAQHAVELQNMRKRIDETVERNARMQFDQTGGWAKSSTLDKVGTIALAFIGGLFGKGDMVMSAIENNLNADIEAQKKAYERGIDLVKGQETSYALAMKEYGDPATAKATAEASARYAAALRIDGLKAKWKSVQESAQADELVAHFGSHADDLRGGEGVGAQVGERVAAHACLLVLAAGPTWQIW